jgi:hypothetical protein
MPELHGSHYILFTWPIWASAFLLYMLTQGVLFVLRDRSEGLYYNTSYSAVLGDGALIVIVLMAAEILKRVSESVVNWTAMDHISAAIVSVAVGVIWLCLAQPKYWGDRYHHLGIASLLCYLGITLLVPVIFRHGTKAEITATICLILIWAVLVVYDAKTKRLDQRNYHGLGEHLNAMKNEQAMWDRHRREANMQ